jgi:protein-disulfide isomerase
MMPIQRSKLGLKFAWFLMLALGFVANANPATADPPKDEIEAVLRDYLASRPELVEQLIREAIAKNPQMLRGAFADMLKTRMGASPSGTPQQQPATGPALSPPDRTAAIKANATDLFTSSRQVNLGNPKGSVTVVEFFDYNCGYCRRAAMDKFALMEGDPDLKVVLKELPILGPQSLEAAQVAVAVRMQDSPDGRLYRTFNKTLFERSGPANKVAALEAARTSGVDIARLTIDLASDEVKSTLDESSRLARVLGITGTPSYVVADRVIPGAVGLDRLREQVQRARQAASH